MGSVGSVNTLAVINLRRHSMFIIRSVVSGLARIVVLTCSLERLERLRHFLGILPIPDRGGIHLFLVVSPGRQEDYARSESGGQTREDGHEATGEGSIRR